MIGIQELVRLHFDEKKSLRQICRDTSIPEGNKSYLGRLLKEAGYEVRRGKVGLKVGDKIQVICPSCGKTRNIISRTSKPYTKLCNSCATAKSHKDNPRIGREENHYNWKGGINLNRQGYVLVYVRKSHQFYPMATNTRNKRFGGYVLQHRLVMAEHLGRCLQPHEIVHHIDGNRQNNEISNLKLTVRQKHGLSYSDAFADGYKCGYEEARQKYDMSRIGYIDVDKYYRE